MRREERRRGREERKGNQQANEHRKKYSEVECMIKEKKSEKWPPRVARGG